MISNEKHDLDVLSHYQFLEKGSNDQNTHLLALEWVKENNQWKRRLIEINKEGVTCLSLFLSKFGIGKFRNVNFSLNKIGIYLLQYQWKNLPSEIKKNPEHKYFKSYITVCHIANRQLRHGRVQLFKDVSNRVESVFNHYWNPAINGRFLTDLHYYRLPQARSLALRFIDSKLSILKDQILNETDLTNIEVGYAYELVTFSHSTGTGKDRETSTDYYYIYPYPPYYSVTSRAGKDMAWRREL